MKAQPKRRESLKRARKRQDLVHAAGCVYDRCMVRSCVREDFSIVNEALVMGIRIPRSLARHWGMR